MGLKDEGVEIYSFGHKANTLCEEGIGSLH